MQNEKYQAPINMYISSSYDDAELAQKFLSDYVKGFGITVDKQRNGDELYVTIDGLDEDIDALVSVYTAQYDEFKKDCKAEPSGWVSPVNFEKSKEDESMKSESNIEDLRDQTISWGTMRSEDLIPKFLGVLKTYAKDKYDEYVNENPEVLDIDGLDDETLGWIVDELFDKLDEIAPEGTYFGAHPDDGADYGFWSVEQYESKKNEDAGIKVGDFVTYDVDSDGKDLDANWIVAEVLAVNDDGTLKLQPHDFDVYDEIPDASASCCSKLDHFAGFKDARHYYMDGRINVYKGGWEILFTEKELDPKYFEFIGTIDDITEADDVDAYYQDNTSYDIDLKDEIETKTAWDTDAMSFADLSTGFARPVRGSENDESKKNEKGTTKIETYEGFDELLGYADAEYLLEDVVDVLSKYYTYEDETFDEDQAKDDPEFTIKIEGGDERADYYCENIFYVHLPSKEAAEELAKVLGGELNESKQTEAKKKYYGYGKDDAIDKEDNDFMWQVAYEWFEDRLPEKLKRWADSAVTDVIDKDSRAYEEIVTMDDYHAYLQKYGPSVIKDIKANNEAKKSEDFDMNKAFFQAKKAITDWTKRQGHKTLEWLYTDGRKSPTSYPSGIWDFEWDTGNGMATAELKVSPYETRMNSWNDSMDFGLRVGTEDKPTFYTSVEDVLSALDTLISKTEIKTESKKSESDIWDEGNELADQIRVRFETDWGSIVGDHNVDIDQATNADGIVEVVVYFDGNRIGCVKGNNDIGWDFIPSRNDRSIHFDSFDKLMSAIVDEFYLYGLDRGKSEESKKSESLTLKQAELKKMAKYGEAEDITGLSDAEAKELKKSGVELVGISRGTYGMNGALMRGTADGKLYVITSRNSNLFYFV